MTALSESLRVAGEDILRVVKVVHSQLREQVIEECARVAERAPLGTMPIDIARAIRGLKDSK